MATRPKSLNWRIFDGERSLRSLGVETQLVIYPNQNHGINRPSYIRDRFERYLAWYDKYLKKAPIAAGASTSDKR